MVAPSTITPDRGVEAVHLGEDLVERLLALVVAADHAAAAAAGAADRVQLVDEDDRRGGLLGLLEQVAHARGADAHDRLDELRRRRREERHARLARHRAREQRLAGAGRARQQHAARDARAELGVLLGVAEEVDHLDELLLGLVDARDVVEVDGLRLGLDALGARAPELAQHPAATGAAAGRAAEQEDEQRDEQDRRAEREQDRLEQRAAVGRLGVDDDVAARSAAARAASSSAKVGISVSKLVALSPLYLTSFLNSPWTVSPLRGDLLDVAVAHLRRGRSGCTARGCAARPGAKIATISQFRTNSEIRMTRKRRPLQGIIGGFCGARSARTSPGLGPRGGAGRGRSWRAGLVGHPQS